ncbi:matrixin family metalloprotease, partial [Chloroflexota bacterium]
LAGDNRIQMVYDAVDFWNQQLAEIGTPFRFGPVTHTTELVPADYLEARSLAVLENKPTPEVPESVKKMPGDIIVALSDGKFVSFSSFPGSKYCIIGIRNFKVSPLNLTNVGRNVIAHELGHAIGLGHHNDPTKLMCGRPADCRPDDFLCDWEELLPVTEENKAYLLEFYPTTWKATK